MTIENMAGRSASGSGGRWWIRRVTYPGAGRRGRGRHGGGPDQPPPVPAAAVSGGGGDPVARPDRAGDARAIIQQQNNARAVLAERARRRSGRAGGARRADRTVGRSSWATTRWSSPRGYHSYFGRDEFAEYTPGMKTVEDARYLRDAILGKFEMAEVAADPAGAGRVADVRRRRCRPDRRRDGRADRGAGAHRAASRLPGDGHPRSADHPVGGGAARCSRRSRTKLQEYTRNASWSRWASRCGVRHPRGGHGPRLDHGGRAGRAGDHPHPHPGLGGRCRRPRRWPGCSPSKIGVEVDRAGRIPVQPDCTLPRAPGGLRDRRHGVAEQAAGSCAAGPAGRQVTSRR